MEGTEAKKVSSPVNKTARTTVIVFFVFMLLHQTDKLLLSSMADPIKKEFAMSDTQWGWLFTGALVVSTILYPIWGWLSDKYHRGKLLAVASFIWGCTTWFSGIAPTPKTFLVARSSTGIDDSSYPGLFSLISDLFEPKTRGKIYGFLQLTQPIGYMLGMVLATVFIAQIGGWRNVFFLTGSLGVVLAVVIFFTVKDVPHGSGEVELQGVETSTYKINWKQVKTLFTKKSLIMVYLQGFFGVFPWNVIVAFIFLYMAEERFYTGNTPTMIMAPAVILMAVGYYAGGYFGDKLFRRIKSGRLIASVIGVAIGMICLWFTMHVPVGTQATANIVNANSVWFAVLLCMTAFFMPFASPNIISTMYDVTVPEIRATANSVESFLENIGAASAPAIAGYISVATSKGDAILIICTTAWALCVIFLLFAIKFIPKDINALHKELEARAQEAPAIQ